jgi:hypothetical protein
MAAFPARRVVSKAWLAPAVILCCLILAPVASARSEGIRYARVSPACPLPTPGNATCFAFVRVPVSSAAAGEAGVKPYTINDGASGSGPSGGLTPGQLASAYGYEPTASGSGQTVAIVDAYDDPRIEADLGVFDSEYGISACTKGDGCFAKVSQTGSATLLPAPDPEGWSLEISLDVETAHSVCPKCKILLVEASTPSFKNLGTAEDEAVSLGATEVSNSYGGPEGEVGATEKADYNHPGIVISAATGDYGYNDWTYLNERVKPPGKPNMPATFPTVVAVGGTTLDLTEAGTRESETVWNGNGPFDENEDEGATGGGCSTRFLAQPWQQQAPGYAATGCGGKRVAADVSADGSPSTGFDVYDTYDCGTYCEERGIGEGWLTVGGTSLATPLISSLYALAGGSGGVSYPSVTLYGHLGQASALYDVTEGGNGICDDEGFGCGANAIFGVNVDCEGTSACNAAPGFDGPSGVGTPNGLSLFKPMLPSAAITPPASLAAGVAASFSGAASSDPYPGGSVESYSWSWGDGTPNGSGVVATHAYAAPGDYTVSLTVTDSYGVTSTPVTLPVSVAAGGPSVGPLPAPATPVPAVAAPPTTSPDTGTQGVSGFHAALTPAIPDAELASSTLQVSVSGAVTVKIKCPADVSECSGTITLRTLNAVIAGAGRAASHKPSILTLATGSFKVAGGKLRVITLHLSKKARALLARSHTLRVRATLVARDPQGASHTTRMIVTLHAPKARHQGA